MAPASKIVDVYKATTRKETSRAMSNEEPEAGKEASVLGTMSTGKVETKKTSEREKATVASKMSNGTRKDQRSCEGGGASGMT